MNVDRILQYCVHCDYPIFRQELAKNRDRVNKVILYPSRHHGVLDLEDFARETIKETWVNDHVIDWTTPGIDWRQAETEPCVALSDSEWLWFNEQDFFVADWDKFYEDIEKAMKTSDMIGWWNLTHFPYVHPSCLFIKRELFEKTKKDFRAHPEINGADHFSMLTHDVKELKGRITTLQNLGYTEWEDAVHLGGLTYVYQDWKGEETHFGVKSPEMFYVYNHFMSKAPVEQNFKFFKLSLEVAEILKKKFPDIDPETSEWKKFFEL